MLRFALALLCCIISCSPVFASFVITGTVKGADGKPLEKAHVHLIPMRLMPAKQGVEVEKDGTFRMTIENASTYMLLQFSGASHMPEVVPLIREEDEKELTVNVQLQPNAFPKNAPGVSIIGDFNNYDFDSAVPMERQPDGTYTTDLKTFRMPVSYQVIIGGGVIRSINGTMYDALEYDGGGDYKSIIDSDAGSVRVIFDPSKLPSTPAAAVVDFGPDAGHYTQFSRLANEVAKRETTLRNMAQALPEGEEGFRKAQEMVKLELEKVAEQIRNEKDDRVRRYRLLFYLQLMLLSKRTNGMPNEMVDRVFAEIPPASRLWEYMPYLQITLFSVSDSTKASAYRKAMLESNPSPKVRLILLQQLLNIASYKGDEKEVEYYYTRLLKEFPDSEEASRAKMQYSPDRAIKKGNRVPAFSVASIDNAGVTYSSENMKGKYYLIDFWATWCGPCVQEMGHLHEAYDQFKDKNFEIISLSFDGKPETVTKFRGKKWNMPWANAFIEGGFESETGKAFEVWGIPKPILIDPNGVIIATEAELRGDQLITTLAKFLDPVARGE